MCNSFTLAIDLFWKWKYRIQAIYCISYFNAIFLILHKIDYTLHLVILMCNSWCCHKWRKQKAWFLPKVVYCKMEEVGSFGYLFLFVSEIEICLIKNNTSFFLARKRISGVRTLVKVLTLVSFHHLCLYLANIHWMSLVWNGVTLKKSAIYILLFD